MDWDKLRVFRTVADAGSLTRAGEILHLSQSAVSRQIRSLEESLDTLLFHRHARGLILTEQGELLFKTADRIRAEIDRTQVRIREAMDSVSGELTVTTTTGFGTLWLAPRIGRLFSHHPELKIDLRLAERVLNLPMREADVAIRMKEPSQAELVRRRLMTVNMRLYATREYLDSRGAPGAIDGLRGHRLVSQSLATEQPGAAYAWVSPMLLADHDSHMTVNNYFGVLQAVLHGVGIGVLPDYVAEEFPQLIHVLPGEQSQDVPVYLAYPEELRHSRRVAAFREFVIEEITAYRRRHAARETADAAVKGGP
ncbi:MAG: LysR family transcriptional regulator [Paracoccaceae bacterium]|nr:LysR family transcriptional regulator [Paracoccaceae bacterium]MDE2914834.1 LysR family transcriptional regulator [Paracoccaceae bacterium]